MRIINKQSLEFAQWVLQRRGFEGYEYKEFFKSEGLKMLKVFNGFSITEKFDIHHIDNSVSVLFENSEFEEICIEKSTFDKISFINCKINKLTLIEANVNSIDFSSLNNLEGDVIQNLTISNSIIRSRYEVNTNVSEFTLTGNSHKHLIIIGAVVGRMNLHGNAMIPSIQIKGFVEKCEISNMKFPFQGPVFFGDLKADSVEISTLQGCANNITLRECSQRNIVFDGFQCLNNLNIEVYFNNSEKSAITFIDCYVGGLLKIDETSADLHFLKHDDDLQDLNYNKISIKRHSGSIKFQVEEIWYKFIVNEFTLEQVIVNSGKELKLTNIYCWKLTFDDFRCDSTGSIIDLTHGSWSPSVTRIEELIVQYNSKTTAKLAPNTSINNKLIPSVVLINSSLGKLEFMNVDLSKFELSFHSSKITDIYLTGSELPTIVKAVITTNPKSQFRQQKIAYSQLKKINEQQGDFVNANMYYAREMNAHFNYLSLREEFFEVINLGLNKISSDHGQSIKSAFWSVIIVSILSFTLFCYLLGYSPTISLSSDSFNVFGRLTSYFFEFLNPVHRLDTFDSLIPNMDMPSSARAIDGFSRIVLAYLIYQFIQAFRKHGKSK